MKEDLGGGLTRAWDEIGKGWVYTCVVECRTWVSEEAITDPRHLEYVRHKFAVAIRAESVKLERG